MTTTAQDLTSREPLARPEAVAMGRIEYTRFVDGLKALEPQDWQRPTDCEGWTVRDLAGHLAGAMETARGLRHLLAEQRAIGRRRKETGESEIDAMSAVQIAAVAALETEDLIEHMETLVEPAVNGRLRIPAVRPSRRSLPGRGRRTIHRAGRRRVLPNPVRPSPAHPRTARHSSPVLIAGLARCGDR
ncbi:MAG: maleylpyruvate isomerase N-terminal domain-containing protein [Acidimicrobiia bacterium]|nr:maleylpyruvate isomerase N-terminal domain-containing protein [Acidimicrobiia bacterium]